MRFADCMRLWEWGILNIRGHQLFKIKKIIIKNKKIGASQRNSTMADTTSLANRNLTYIYFYFPNVMRSSWGLTHHSCSRGKDIKGCSFFILLFLFYFRDGIVIWLENSSKVGTHFTFIYCCFHFKFKFIKKK